MIKNINIICFRIFALTWAAFCLSLASKSYLYREQNVDFCLINLAIGLLPVAIGWNRLWTKHAEMEAIRWQFMWQEITKNFPVLALSRQFCLALSSTIFLAFAILLTPFLLWQAAASCAIVIDSAGYYELAERLYQLKPGRLSGESLSVERHHQELETAAQLLERNNAVMAVYGKKSLEMIRRYHYAGVDVSLQEGCTSNNNLTFYWLEKSLSLAREQKSSENILKALIQIAINSHFHERVGNTNKLMDEIEQILAHSVDVRRLNGNSRPLLHWLASKMGRMDLARVTAAMPWKV